jgi:hypothetical protein
MFQYCLTIETMSVGGFECHHPTFPCIILKIMWNHVVLDSTLTRVAHYGLIMVKRLVINRLYEYYRRK